MEAHQHIRQWLDSRQDYQPGLALAKAYGVAGVQLVLLEAGENNLTKRKLREALQSVLDTLSAQAAAPTATPAAQVVAAPTPTAPEPPELVQLRARRTATFKQAQHHHSAMRTAPEGPERLKHATQIKVLFRENARLWEQEAYYLKFGFLPVPTPAAATIDRGDPAAVLLRRNTLRTYVSDAENGKRAKNDPDKLAAWSAELLELNLILAHGQPVSA